MSNKATEILELLGEETVPGAMAHLSLAICHVALQSGLSKEQFMSGMSVCYDSTKKAAKERAKCH